MESGFNPLWLGLLAIPVLLLLVVAGSKGAKGGKGSKAKARDKAPARPGTASGPRPAAAAGTAVASPESKGATAAEPAAPAEPELDPQEAAERAAQQAALREEHRELLADFFLVMEEHLNEVELETITEMIADLRQPPPMLERITHGLDDPEELAEAVKANPALSADLLRIVNSAAFALLSPISSIQHAITFLGVTLVKGLVMQSAVFRVMEVDAADEQPAYLRLWRSSYVASSVALLLAQSMGLQRPSVLSTQALLSNLGDLTLLSAHPDLADIYAQDSTLFERVRAQQDALVANSAIIGARLAAQWKLPGDLERSLRNNLVPMAVPPDEHPEAGTPDFRAAVLCYAACRIGDQVGFGTVRDMADIEFGPEQGVEYYYLQDYLERADLLALREHLNDPVLRRKVNHIVATFAI